MRLGQLRSGVLAAAVAGLGLTSITSADVPALPSAPAPRVALRVRARNTMTVAALDAASRAASERLAEPGCARVLSDFTDAGGRTLQQRLDATAASSGRLLVYLYDGASRASCQGGRRLAVTEPGSHVVHVCPQFVLRERQDPTQAHVVIIHEVLHALGLGETSLSSNAITRQVGHRCGG